MNTQRRHFSGAEKVAILKRHLVEKVPVSDLCDELHIYPNQLYGWLKEFFENGHAAFSNGRKAKALEDAKDKKLQQLEAKLYNGVDLNESPYPLVANSTKRFFQIRLNQDKRTSSETDPTADAPAPQVSS